MAHRRHTFLVYPPGYIPGKSKFVETASKRQAWKAAVRMGYGAEVRRCIRMYDAKRTFWSSSISGIHLWTICKA